MICLAVVSLGPGAAAAAPVWIGDLESGDFSQWSYLLNPEINGVPYAQVIGDTVVQGRWAARIELHNDALWPNGLKRVELQHGPEPARTAEGATTFFAWSFYLPEVLSADPSQQIGYWESANSYQQMMAFEVSGQRIMFSTRRPQNVVQWDADGVVTAGVWHRIAMRILWSKDPAVGEVDVWFDGDQVVTAAAAQTLADDNPHFTQVGLLRGQVEFADVPVIVIDDAVEGDLLEDVHPDPAPPGGSTSDSGGETGETGGGGSSGDATTSTTGDGSSGDVPEPTTGAPAGTTTTAAETTGATTGTGGSGAGAGETGAIDKGDDAGGCGCDVGPPGLGSLGLLLLARRRRRAPR